PQVDATDFYLFRSYEAGREDTITIIANYHPLQDPYGGPNYFPLDPDAFYDLNLDTDGDARPDLVFRFQYAQTSPFLALPVGDAGAEETVAVPLSFVGPYGAGSTDTLNVRRFYSVRVLAGGSVDWLRHAASGGALFSMPFDNAGAKSAPDYAAYAAQHVFPIAVPGCGAPGRIFLGQRQESFAVNLGEIFDLVNLDPVGDRDAAESDLADKNVTTFAIELPIACLDGAGDVIGGWTTAWKRRTSVRLPAGQVTYDSPTLELGGFEQVSRLGMPLVNEVVIGLPDKDRFNASAPDQDGQFLTYVTHPTLPELLEVLFGVSAPNHFPRNDLVAAFLTGVPGLNAFGVPAEMVRLNTAIPPTPASLQHNLGALGGDNAGFPNGRRPGDDVVDIELRVAMGVLCHAFPGAFCVPADAPSGHLPYTDQALQDASQFDATFPSLRTPRPGSPGSCGEPDGIRGSGRRRAGRSARPPGGWRWRARWCPPCCWRPPRRSRPTICGSSRPPSGRRSARW
ncbi:MAG TPA: DUF4331 domain-containing protein, partial [Thermoanaerobaculia bacterium]|nr:DUF4331 domain-containing protein [Thermoanaerobaculia bacterium]